MTSLPDEVEVLVVGAGPTGLTAAILLRRMGLRVAVVERRHGPQRAPAAHVVSARSFEIWRQAGVDVDALRAHALDPAAGGAVHWVRSLGGEVLGSLPFERQGDEMLAVTPTPLRNLSQHRLEPLLAAELAALGDPVHYGHAWRALEEAGAGAVSSVDGPGGPRRVRSRWVLGCDGAGSAVRRAVGITPEGPARLQSFVMIHLAADLRPLVGEAPGVLYWVCDPAAGGTFVAHDPAGDWVYMLPFDPDTEDLAEYTEARCRRLVGRALGGPAPPMEVRTVASWAMTAQVADRYREGPVFVVGDAAHRFPPTGGLGLNTGVQDAHNLAWKLAAVWRAEAPAAILDSYQRERRPVARRNAEVSLANALRLLEVPAALGAHPDPATASLAFEQVLGSADGRAALSAAIAAQAPHFDMLGLQLGYRYGAPEGPLDPTGDEVRRYRPSAEVGARLPHAWVTHRGARCSTLDLVPLDRPVVLSGPDGPPGTIAVGRDLGGAEGWWADLVELPPGGSLVVRPDQHVAARAPAGPAPDPWAATVAATGP